LNLKLKQIVLFRAVALPVGKGRDIKFILEQATTAQRGSRGLYSFFNLDPRWGGWSTPRSGRFIPEKGPGTRCIEGWMDPRAGLDGRVKSRSPTGVRSPDRPVHSESLWSGYRIPAEARFSAPVQTGPGAHPASWVAGLSRG